MKQLISLNLLIHVQIHEKVGKFDSNWLTPSFCAAKRHIVIKENGEVTFGGTINAGEVAETQSMAFAHFRKACGQY